MRKSKAMKIYISATMTIAELNRKFRRYFPYLKLELQRDPDDSQGYMGFCPEDMRLVEASGVVKEGEIVVHSDLTVAEICRRFFERHLLAVRVFCKNHQGWADASNPKETTQSYIKTKSS